MVIGFMCYEPASNAHPRWSWTDTTLNTWPIFVFGDCPLIWASSQILLNSLSYRTWRSAWICIYIYNAYTIIYIYTRSYACVCICIYIHYIYTHYIYIHTIYRRRCIWSSASCYLEPVQVQLTIPPGIHHVSIHQSYLPIIPSISIPFFLTQYYLIKICFNPIFFWKKLGSFNF